MGRGFRREDARRNLERRSGRGPRPTDAEPTAADIECAAVGLDHARRPAIPIDIGRPYRTKIEQPNPVAKKVRVAKLPVLPAYYYLDHFLEMLGFVQRTYGP